MSRLLSVLLLLAACNSTPKNELAFTRWKLYSMNDDSAKAPDTIADWMIKSFNEDTSLRVYADFNTDTTVYVYIIDSFSKDTSFSNFKRAGDTLFILHTETNDTDTLFVKTLSKEQLHLNSKNGVAFKFKKAE